MMTKIHYVICHNYGIPDSKGRGANMGPIWGRQDPDGPHVGPMNFAIRDTIAMPYHCSCHRIIMKFSRLITIDKSDVHARGQGQRSKAKVTEVMSPLSRFRTVTPVWIHIWWWNDAQSLMLIRRGALLFFKVIHQISRSHSIEDVPYCFLRSSIKFQGHAGWKMDNLYPIWDY